MKRNFHGLPEKPQALVIIFIVLARIALHFIVVQAEPQRSARDILKGGNIFSVPTNEPFKESVDVDIVHGRRPSGGLKSVVADFDLAPTHSPFP